MTKLNRLQDKTQQSNQDMAHIVDRLFDILHTPDFLGMKGLANEVPIFVHAYDAPQEDAVRRMVDGLVTRLRNNGVSVVLIDLFDLILEQLDEENRLQRIVDREVSLGKAKLLDMMINLADPKTRLIPRLDRQMGAAGVQLTLLTGVGRVFPYLRTHSILENLQPAMQKNPIVMFFPGNYVQEEDGSQLHLFGEHTNPKLSRAYYRAINLAKYQP